MLIIALTVFFLPDSPRWLIANGYEAEAIEILAKVRGDLSLNDPVLIEEIQQLRAVVEASHHKRNNIWNLAIGRHSGKLHLGRRAWLGFWLQADPAVDGNFGHCDLGICSIHLAGFDSYKAAWLGGLVNTFGVVGTAAAALVVDRLGRVRSLLISFIVQGISLFLGRSFHPLRRTRHRRIHSRHAWYGLRSLRLHLPVLFTMFNIIPCWIYGSEIFPQEVRAKGYSFTIFGWAIAAA